MDIECIELNIGIDGLPLFKSSSVQLWPILGKVLNLKIKCIFPIGIYCGNKKSANFDNFLQMSKKSYIQLEFTSVIECFPLFLKHLFVMPQPVLLFLAVLDTMLFLGAVSVYKSAEK